jgi:hypothetical protein
VVNVMSWRFLLLSLVILIQPTLAGAVEYRLQMVSIYDDSFASYLDVRSRGASPLDRLESALDRQQIPKGTVLYDRWVEPAEASVARVFGATPVKAELAQDREPFLPEYRWQGEPGARTLWVVKPRSYHFHKLEQLGLKGAGPLLRVLPFAAAVKAERSKAVGFPANLIDASNGGGELWKKWLSRYLDLSDGIAAVVGFEANPTYPDRVYLLIEQGSEPRTFKAVLGWRKRLGVEENLFLLGGDMGGVVQ